MQRVLSLWIVALCLALAASTTKADEVQLPRTKISGGTICDTPELVIERIQTDTYPEGCTRLMQPLWADVYLTGVYEFNDMRFALARYEFPFQDEEGNVHFEIRYGWWGRAQILPTAL